MNNNIVPQLRSRPAIDANHTNVWYMGEGCTTDGTQILPDVGSVTLVRTSGGGVIQTGYSLFDTQKSAYATENTVSGSTRFSAALSPTIGTSQAFTLESIILFPPETVNTVPQYIGAFLVSVVNPSPPPSTTDYAQILYREATTRPGFLTQRNSSGYNSSYSSFGASNDQVVPGLPSHFMLTWEPAGASGTQNFYIDGRLLTTYTGGLAGDRFAAFNAVTVNFICGASLADLRISNIARSQLYAIEATRSMRAL